MKRIILIIVCLGFIYNNALAQNVAINESGSAPNSKAILDVSSDIHRNKGVLLPRVTTSQRNAISPASSDTGLTVFDTDTKSYWWWDGTVWVEVGVDNRYWKLTGNSGTTPGTDFIGTTDGQDLVIKTNNAERIRITSGGNVGIGTTSPAELLHLNGNIRGNQSGALRISTGNGYVDVGPKNSSWCHFYTDRGRYWFNKGLTVDGGLIGSYNEDLQLQTSGTTRIYVNNSNGYVGIGTNSPSSRLEIYGDQQNVEISNTSETDAGIIFNDAQATGSQYAKITYGCGDNDLNFLNASSTPRMVIESSGEVGIGTTAPTATLQVNGTFRYVDGNQAADKVLVSDANGNATWQSLAQNTYGTNNQGVSGTTDATLSSSSFVDMPEMSITFTPNHSVVYVYFTFSAYANASAYPMEYVDFRILRNGTVIGGSNCLVEDYDDVDGVVTSFNGAMSLAVPVTAGSSTTIKVQWRRDGIYTSDIYCNPASEPDYCHRSLIIID